ncbi:putative ABC transporter permease subunit [Clostridium algidicarnis]|uniref:ABC-2 type transport system permease protein n=1 Tax=Clostridium algidicarnis TaxID=37659 RepID=A0ABS6C0L3_9CLOT|nr:hypothetical protein [Clostridium algidicarnis]MBU3219006.1 hypothetical protein [Clostridium algidicarnis]
MSKIFILIKVLFKNGSGNEGKRKSKFPSMILNIFLGLILVMSIGVPIGTFTAAIYKDFAVMGQEGIILSLAFSMVSFIIFIFGIIYVLTTFYFSKDIEALLPLPLKADEILSAKFITVLIYEYLTELIVLLPVIIGYGVKANTGISYWMISIIIFLLLPVMPLVLASILNMVIMRFTNLGKHKDAFRVVGGILAIFSGLGVNLLVQKASSSNMGEQNLLEVFAKGNNSMMNLLGGMFPTSKLAALALVSTSVNKGIMNLLLFILITVISFGVFMILARILYFKGVMGSSESFSKRKELKSKEFDKITSENSKIKSYVIKELRVVFRTPAFLLNCVVGTIVFPIFMIIYGFMDPNNIQMLTKITGEVKDPKLIGIIFGVAFSVILFISGSNAMASTSISREGELMFINKYIPITYREQIFSKIISSVIVNMISIILITAMIIILKLPLSLIISIFIISILGSVFTSTLGVVIDINRPKLNWDNEQKAVKQNINSFISFVISILIGGLNIYLFFKLKPTLLIGFISLVVVIVLIIALLIYYINGKGQEVYGRIE